MRGGCVLIWGLFFGDLFLLRFRAVKSRKIWCVWFFFIYIFSMVGVLSERALSASHIKIDFLNKLEEPEIFNVRLKIAVKKP